MRILFNLLWWWYLGGAVEKRIGSGKLVVITVISALPERLRAAPV